MYEERISRLERQLRSFQKAFRDMQIQNEVLLSMLDEAAILTRIAFETALHSRYCAGVRKSSSASFLGQSFLRVVQEGGLTLSLCAFAGRSAIPSLSGVAKTVSTQLRSFAPPALADAVPARLLFNLWDMQDGLKLQYFVPSSGAILQLPAMLEPRSLAATVRAGHAVYVLGGHTLACSGDALDSVEVYIDGQDSWSRIPSMSCRRSGPAAAIWDGRVFVMGGSLGGQRSYDNYLASVECYNVETCTWTALPPMSYARFAATAAATRGKVLVCSGWRGGHARGTLQHSVECFDTASHAWETLHPMLSWRHRAVAVAKDCHVYVFGGYSMKACERYDMDTGTWTTLPPLSFATPSTAAVLDGFPVALREKSPNSVLFAWFDEYTNEWRTLPDLHRCCSGGNTS